MTVSSNHTVYIRNVSTAPISVSGNAMCQSGVSFEVRSSDTDINSLYTIVGAGDKNGEKSVPVVGMALAPNEDKEGAFDILQCGSYSAPPGMPNLGTSALGIFGTAYTNGSFVGPLTGSTPYVAGTSSQSSRAFWRNTP